MHRYALGSHHRVSVHLRRYRSQAPGAATPGPGGGARDCAATARLLRALVAVAGLRGVLRGGCHWTYIS
eukprot:5502658-Prymnesium_polylepis.1